MTKRYHNYNIKKNKHRHLKKKKPSADRLKLLGAFFVIAFSIIIFRLGYIQIWQHKWWEAVASESHDFYKDLFPVRGEIYIQDPYSVDGKHKIAMNQELSVIYANPWLIEDKARAINELSPLLNVGKEELEQKLEPKTLKNGRQDTYEVLKRKISNQEKEAIEALEIKGLGFTEETWRYYPNEDYTAHITGFLGMSNDKKVGQYGLEGYFDDELSGAVGYLQTEKDASGGLITIGDKFVEQAHDGDDLFLTIDKNVQFYACNALKESVEKHGAKQGTVIIMKPSTGAIIASCNYPSYDPNKYSDVDDIDYYLDDAVADQYEPGSVFKSFAISSAINEGKITPYTTYEDTGEAYVDGWPKPIKNSDGKANGVVDMNDVLSLSLNTGSIFAVEQIGNEAWYQYVTKFGFGEKTGIELAGENNGNISALEKLANIYSATSSYGQGITVTPIQLITAYNAIANGGKLMKPYIISEKVKSNGNSNKTQPQVVREVLSPQTAQTVSAMLVNVIDSGHAAHAGVDGYYIAGKTGTAQVVKEDGSGYHSIKHKDTFVGFGPISDPQFIMLTKIDEPKDVMWSASSAAPLFGDIASYLVNYYQIPPDK